MRRYLVFVLIAAFIAVAAFAAACSDDGSPVTKDACTGSRGAIVPLYVGNMWVNRTQTTDAQGNPKYRYDTLRVVAVKDSADAITNVFRHYYLMERIGLNHLLFYEGRQLKFATYGANLFSMEPMMQLTYPMEFGEIVLDTGKTYSDVVNEPPFTWRHTLELVSCERVTIPAGTFQCLKYLMGDESTPWQPVKIYAVPGVGIIKTEQIYVSPDRDSTVSATTELMTYRVFK